MLAIKVLIAAAIIAAAASYGSILATEYLESVVHLHVLIA